MDRIVAACPDCEMVVFNKFRRDHEGRMNFFVPVSGKWKDEAVEMRSLYLKNLSLGGKKRFIEECDPLRLITFFNSEDSYFADWRRYGADVGYGDVRLDVRPSSRAAKIAELGSYAVVHDSKFPELGGRTAYLTKAWYGAEWSKVCCRLRDEMDLKVVQMGFGDQPAFDSSAVTSCSVLGIMAGFWDYWHLLAGARLYVGTDSWPAHAAILMRGPQFVLLKGAVSRRWDHGGRYSRIIRKGKCQACEGPQVSSMHCIWRQGSHECMNLITADDVIVEARAALCSDRQ
jgi:hypothetical protein